MDWLYASDLMKTARDGYAGKPLGNNTRLHYRGDGFAIRHWSTDILTIHKDGTFTFHTGGWNSVTTWQRLHSYGPSLKQIYDRTLCKKLYNNRLILREPAVWETEDPEPPKPDRTIFPPFYAVDPGPEPIDDGVGCRAGTVEEYSYQEDQTLILDGDRKPGDFTFRKVYDDGSVNSRLTARRARNGILIVGKESSSWADPTYNDYRHRTRVDYKQCPHCAAFQKIHERWDHLYNGPRWGKDSGKGWKLYTARMAEYGSEAKWKEAALCDFRYVKAAREEWRAWAERNTIPYFDGIVINGDGYVDEKNYQRMLKAERKRDRERRKRERERQAELKRLAAEKMAAAETWSRENAVKCKVDPDAVIWLIDHGVKINADGKTVTLYKSVLDDLTAKHDPSFQYVIGETAEAGDYETWAHCGGGLHFWPSVDVANHMRWGPIMIECEVELRTLIAIDRQKCKARSCKVVRIVEDQVEEMAA